MKKSFETYLREENLSENTIRSYLFSVRLYETKFKKISAHNIAEYKKFLVQNYKEQTVNLRLIALSKYLKFRKKERLCPKLIRENRRSFVENVISNRDYEFLKDSLRNDGRSKEYFIVRFLGSTGVRVSELVQLKIDNIIEGFADIRSKGGKIRRIYIPESLQKDTLAWLQSHERTVGFLFPGKSEKPLSTRAISAILEKSARTYKIDRKVMHPHSFRHLFAKNFLQRHGELAFLADLLGHESIDTTRIYLQKSSDEQREIVNSLVNW